MEGKMVVQKQPKENCTWKSIGIIGKVGLKAKRIYIPLNCLVVNSNVSGSPEPLAVKPDIILLDEPTSALDPELVGEGALQALKMLAQEGWTMIIVTHELNFAKDVADRVILMENGQVVGNKIPRLNSFSHPQQERTKQFLLQAKMPMEFRRLLYLIKPLNIKSGQKKSWILTALLFE